MAKKQGMKLHTGAKRLGGTFLVAASLLLMTLTWPVPARDETPLSPPGSLPFASAHGEWNDFAPASWVTSTTIVASVQVTDPAGLSLVTALYAYSTDGGLDWTNWAAATAAETVSTTAIINAPPLTFGDGVTNVVRFDISDTAPIPATDFSPTYTLRIDSVPPSSIILIPANDALITETIGGKLLINGIAADATSGLDRVEISTDSGSGWATAAGTTAWSYTWTLPLANNISYPLRARAVDLAGNFQATMATAIVTIGVTRETFLPIVLNPPSDTYEPNDSRSGAYGPLTSGTTYDSYLWSASDTWDCYWFDPSSLGTVTIDLTSIPSGTDYDLFLYDSTTSTSSVARSQNLNNADEQIVYSLGHADRHYVCIYAFSGWSNTDSYLLRVIYP